MSDDVRVIRTPDQRLRVFVSSTLKELAAEREAVQRAITNLRLSPVMFEMGARPHPSRDLYRAYLQQSQIFIGIYWQQYGWVAPDMEISGIEDEYLLASELPKLIYLKSPAKEIDPGLKVMIRQIQSDNTVSYKRFSTADELQELIENDLAVMMTEQFYALEQITRRMEEKSGELTSQISLGEIEHNLPLQPTPFIGRENEVREVSQILNRDEVRLLTLTGPGGTGKTRLSLQVANRMLKRFKSGVFFVLLADLSNPDLVVSKIAQQLGVREGGSQPLVESLKSYLYDKEILLLLDNFEQILRASDIVPVLLAGAPRLKILVTSRIRLNLQGEYEYPVPPLGLPDQDHRLTLETYQQSEALQLFSSRASAVSPHFELSEDNAHVVAEICFHLDGLPLAIELAAARVKILPPEEILNRLGHRLQLLTGGARDLPERQRTMRNTLDWSYSLLDRGIQILFSRLGVFVGGFTLVAAEAICQVGKNGEGELSCEVDVLDGIEALLNNSLLRLEEIPGGQRRYRMLETIREYALEHLTGGGELESIRDQHAQYFINEMTGMSLHFQTSEAEYQLDWVEAEHDNLRAALSWCLDNPKFHELGVLLLVSLNWFWFRRGYLSEGREWSNRMLDLPVSKGRSDTRGMALFSSAALAMWQGDLIFALLSIEEALLITRWLEYPYQLAVVSLFNGTVLVNMGKDNEALPLLEEAQALFEELNMPWMLATTKVHMGNAALGMGDTTKALTYLEQAHILSQEINEKWLITFVLNNYGEVSRVLGEYDQARTYYEQSEALLREMGDKGELARLVHNLGYVALHKGDLNQARTLFRESLAMFLKLSNQRGIAECLAAMAGLWAEEGKFEASARMLGAASALLDQTGGSWWPADRVEYERNLQKINDGLARDVFDATWKAGQGMTLDEATALAERIG
jgi:predicted ATPase